MLLTGRSWPISAGREGPGIGQKRSVTAGGGEPQMTPRSTKIVSPTTLFLFFKKTMSLRIQLRRLQRLMTCGLVSAVDDADFLHKEDISLTFVLGLIHRNIGLCDQI